MSDTTNGNDPDNKEKLKALPAKFYKAASVVDTPSGYQILLDERAVKTPKRELLLLPTRALADAVRDEWHAQKSRIDPETMPLTKYSNTAIDGIKGNERAVIDAIAAFVENDLVCYRADAPHELVALQVTAWDPLLEWAHDDLGLKLVRTSGVMPVEQPQSARIIATSILSPLSAFELAAVHVLSTITGSLMIAFALIRGQIDPAEAWAKAHIDEDYQISQWGQDDEAAKRRAYNHKHFSEAHRLLLLLQ